ncbi:kinase-like protein [Basidiobolus meristosporus CBS 931.73]|uniref:non-specific serine/threonine protein kinase n=1 Tax=Basidiobolus meristosporus CBS 931.73 TaxID=1314790 RepID=A0A1Y1YM36_9FUNG|nr:kinase-like protein [Basidiobolus meristosporus CBS 931.73]|eukprot:ORX99048.1 kinase-like protein [Basidiobolus meristosporus CBS 931.73]
MDISVEQTPERPVRPEQIEDSEESASEEATPNTRDLQREISQREMHRFLQSFPSLSEKYTLLEKTGEGTFSTVYKAIDLDHQLYDNSMWKHYCPAEPNTEELALKEFRKRKLQEEPVYVAIKRIYVTSSPARIANEISILRDLSGHDCILPLITACRHQDQVVVILPYFEHDDFRDFYRKLSIGEMKPYFRALFRALEIIHKEKIIHRDIKPSNFLYNVAKQQGALVDFGLAQVEPFRPVCVHHRIVIFDCVEGGRVRQRSSQNPSIPAPSLPTAQVMASPMPAVRANRAGTRGFRAPEVLFKHVQQTGAIDIWSAGVILLCVMSQRFPFFNSNSDQEALLEIACLFGKKAMQHAAALLNRSFITNVPTVHDNPIGWERLIKYLNPNGFKDIPVEAFDLLKRCMSLDPQERITASEALRHPFLVENDVVDVEL